MSEKKYALLPADDAVQNWFEENIDKECSASSAVYKFRLWLEELQGAPKPGAAWIKASTWPQDHNMVHWRRVEDKRPLLVIGRNYQDNVIAQFGKVYTPEELEWLDESGTPYESPAEQPVVDENDGVEFDKWCKVQQKYEFKLNAWHCRVTGEKFTWGQLYEIWESQLPGTPEQPVREVEFVLAYTPCMDDDPDYCGDYTSNDGQELCCVKEIQVPVLRY